MKPDPNGRVRSLIAGNCALYHAFELRRLADIMHRTNDDKAAVI